MVKRIQRWLLLILLIVFKIFGKKRSLIKYNLIKENQMGLVYEVTLPSIGAPDVKSRVLTYSVNGVSKDVNLLNVETIVVLPAVRQGDSVVVTFKEIDDVGNISEPSDPVSFVASDTLAPPKPGLFAVKLVEETVDPEVAAPVVEPVEPVNVIEAEAVVAPPVANITLED
jgi:hypothetical protein